MRGDNDVATAYSDLFHNHVIVVSDYLKSSRRGVLPRRHHTINTKPETLLSSTYRDRKAVADA